MKRIVVNAYAKINLSLKVGELLATGYHDVTMVMQLIRLCDYLYIGVAGTDGPDKADLKQPEDPVPEPGEFRLTCSNPDLPTGDTNLVRRAYDLLAKKCPDRTLPGVAVYLEKRIPVAAGLAGGSADGAAALLGLNKVLKTDLSMDTLMDLAAELGSDVPFALQGIALDDEALRPRGFDPAKASTLALATGRGTELTPYPQVEGWLLLAKPKVSVSTGKAYGALDDPAVRARIQKTPDADKLLGALAEGDYPAAYAAMGNDFEAYTPYAYPEVSECRDFLEEVADRVRAKWAKADEERGTIQMSGTGPTLFFLDYNQITAVHMQLAFFNNPGDREAQNTARDRGYWVAASPFLVVKYRSS